MPRERARMYVDVALRPYIHAPSRRWQTRAKRHGHWLNPLRGADRVIRLWAQQISGAQPPGEEGVPLSSTTVPRRRVPAWLPVATVAAVAAAVHLAVATRYGWHPDELYYVICGQHPAWGYIDHPPLVPMLARLASATPNTLLTLRLLAVAAQTGCIVLAGLLAAELGGRRLAQVVAAAAVAACPLFMGASVFLGTTVLDQLAWLAVLVLVARALRVRTVPAWLGAGAVAGIGLETKHTIAVLLVGIALALVIFHRAVLRTAGPWLAAGLAALLAAPNVVWNATHGWPSLQFAQTMSRRMGGPLGSLTHLPMQALVWAGPLLVVLWVLGIRWLASPAGREHRWLLVVAAVTVLVFTATGGRPYYAAPILAALFAAGAMRVEAAERTDMSGWMGETALPPIGWSVALIASFAGAVVACLPVLPVSLINTQSRVNPVPAETYGWPYLVDRVAAAAKSLPADAPIFTSNYGEAAALSILGPPAGLHRPVYSGDNNYTRWGPPSGRPETVVCVGQFPVKYLKRYWSRVKLLATITFPSGVRNGESGARIYLCQQPRVSWADIWPSLRHSWPYL